MNKRKPFRLDGFIEGEYPLNLSCHDEYLAVWVTRDADDDIPVTVREVLPPCRHERKVIICGHPVAEREWCEDCGAMRKKRPSGWSRWRKPRRG